MSFSAADLAELARSVPPPDSDAGRSASARVDALATPPGALGRLADIQALAPWVLYARIGQSLAHLSGTGPVNVFVRASFWSAQLALFGWMLVKLLA